MIPSQVHRSLVEAENVWQPMEDGDMIGVDWRMRVQRADRAGTVGD